MKTLSPFLSALSEHTFCKDISENINTLSHVKVYYSEPTIRKTLEWDISKYTTDTINNQPYAAVIDDADLDWILNMLTM